jgi:hypothetical protein
MKTGLYFPGRKMDISFTHLVLQLMVPSDLPSYLHAFEGMMLKTGISFTFSHSNDDHKVIIIKKAQIALRYSRISHENSL